jgi:MFS family permease
METVRLAVESPAQKTDSRLGLYLASFLFSLNDNCSLTALPWCVMALGGQALAVGSIGALYLGSYTLACFLFSARLGRLGPKRQVLFCSLITIFFMAAIPLLPSVALVLLLTALKGMTLCTFWPPLMGWISAGTEGGPLNRRLGIFNFSWCSGAIVGSWLGGTLFAVRPWLPFAVAALTTFAAGLFAASVQEKSTSGKKDDTSLPAEPEPFNLVLFRWIARIGLFTGWMVFASFRISIASLINEMSLGSRLHATVVAGVNFIMMVCFYLLGRSRSWHFRFWAVIAAQLLITAALIGIAKSDSANQLIFFAVAGTPALAFVYSSHLYYSFSSRGNPQKNASIHEILLAVGFSLGSLGAGALGQFSGNRPVYLALAGVMLVTLAVQAVLFLTLKPKTSQE